MIIMNLKPNTPEWEAYRSNPNIFNASEAPAMMGKSPYMTRQQLIKQYALGITEVVDDATQRRFNDGHKFEEMARPLAEEIVGEELAPIVGLEDCYSASFDGINFDGDVIWEHKTLNDSIREVIQENGKTWGKLPEHYRIQMEQQLMVSGGKACLFMASKWKREMSAYVLEEMRWCWYEPDLKLRAEIIAGWAQFAEDVKNYKHKAADKVIVAKTFETMPVLNVSLQGIVSASNLHEFKAAAAELIDSINTDLQTDQDFADAEKAIRWLKGVEENIESTKANLLKGMSDVDAVFKALDSIKEDMARQKRLQMEKLVKTEHERKMSEIINAGRDEIAKFFDAIEEKVKQFFTDGIAAKPQIIMPDFLAAVKGKKSWATREAAISDAIASTKASATVEADRIIANLQALADVGADYPFLWSDAQVLVEKPQADMLIIAKARIADHEKAAQEKLAAEAARQAAESEKQNPASVIEERVQAAAKASFDNKQDQRFESDFANVFCADDVKQEPGRPSDQEIIGAVATCFNVSVQTALDWIVEIGKRDAA